MNFIQSLITHLRKYLMLCVSLVRPQSKTYKQKMLEKYNEYNFEKTYVLAQDIRDYVFSDEIYDISLPANLNLLLKPQKWSLLHQFIFDNIKLWNQDIINDCGGEETLNGSYKNTLTVYGVTFFNENNYPNQNEYDDNRDYSIYLFNLIESKCLRQITEEVFYILFGDREFLMKFNQLVSNKIHSLDISKHEDILQNTGILKRPNSWNTWVKNAIRHRDKDECVFCGKDLTAIKNNTKQPEIDHIVSLNEGGSNDITNLQYSCNQCNNEKSDTTKTSKWYIPYYKLE